MWDRGVDKGRLKGALSLNTEFGPGSFAWTKESMGTLGQSGLKNGDSLEAVLGGPNRLLTGQRSLSRLKTER